MSIDILKENIEALRKQLKWLEHSYNKCRQYTLNVEYTEDEFDNLETLSSRFARSIDLLVRKVFRSLDDVEFENQGTLIDVVNNAHKRELFDTMEEIRTIKEIRNEIAHEYIDEGLKEIFDDILKYTPRLIDIIKKTLVYSEKYI